ncbi:hypothetical protein BJY52DRAFT_1419496 [Lactarius psammicola]|nr:hypothetical protein BJY52DRAFT_1419496 [Lactarius psammicola]
MSQRQRLRHTHHGHSIAPSPDPRRWTANGYSKGTTTAEAEETASRRQWQLCFHHDDDDESSNAITTPTKVLNTDTILRSCDSHDFRVPRHYIVDSSPVLGERIIAANCRGIESDASCEATTVVGGTSLPVVQLAESHAILSSLLTFVFPVLPVLPSTIEETLELLSTCQKYKMTTVLIRIRDRAFQRDPSLICPGNALHVYSLAQKYGLRKEALLAAEATLKFPMTIRDYEDKLDIMPGAAFCELWKYRRRVFSNLTEDLAAFIETGVREVFGDLHCVEFSASRIPLWLDNYIASVAKDLACLDPTYFHLALSSHVSRTGISSYFCKKCISIPRTKIHEFWTAMTTVVRNSVRKAESYFSPTQWETRFQRPTFATMRASPLPEGFNTGMQGADVILQSSDLVLFRVHKSILAISSPFFDDMFSLPQPPDGEVVDGLPVPLDGALPYPFCDIDSYENTLALLAAAQKYEMTTVQSTVRAEISRGGRQWPTTTMAFRIYAIASNKQLIPEMETAAQLTLDHPMTFETIADALPFFEGSALRDLAGFRKRCCNNLLSVFESFLDDNYILGKWYGCRKTRRPPSNFQSGTHKGTLAGWLHDFISRYINSLQATFTCSLPSPESLRVEYSSALRAHLTETNCSFCPTVHAMEGDALREYLHSRVSEARNRESLRFDAETSNPSESGNSDIP